MRQRTVVLPYCRVVVRDLPPEIPQASIVVIFGLFISEESSAGAQRSRRRKLPLRSYELGRIGDADKSWRERSTSEKPYTHFLGQYEED